MERDSEIGECVPLVAKPQFNLWTWRSVGCGVLLILILAATAVGGFFFLGSVRHMAPPPVRHMAPPPVISKPTIVEVGDDQFFSVMKEVYGEHWDVVRPAASGMSSKDQEEWAKTFHGNQSAYGATYGEVNPDGFRKLLQAPNLGAKPNEKFYDLGAGDGKLVMVAWLMGLQATGIELATKRFTESCRALGDAGKVQKPPTTSSMMRFYKGSFTTLSWADADIIFMDNVCWPQDVMQQIATAAKQLKKGTRIVLSRPLENNEDFVTVETLSIQASWSKTEVTIQRKVTETISPVKHSVDPPRSLGAVPAEDHCEV